MSWEQAPTRRRVSPSALVVAALVAVGVVLAVATSVGGGNDDRLAVDSDADDPSGSEDAGNDRAIEPGSEDPQAEDPQADEDVEPIDEEADPVEEDPEAPASDTERLEPSDDLVLPGDTGLELFLRTHSGDLARVDLDTGELVATDAGSLGMSTLAVTGDTILYERNGKIIAWDTELEGESWEVAEGYEVFPAAGPGEVWVVHQSEHHDGRPGINLVRVDDGSTIAEHDLRVNQVIGADGDHLVVEQHGHLSVQSLGSDESHAIGSGRPIGHAGGWVAWLDCQPDLTCDVVVSAVEGDEERRVAFEPASDAPWFSGLVSPTGEHVIAPVFYAPGEGPAAVVLSVRTGDTAVLEEATGGGPMGMAWAPDGSWAFVGVPGQGVLAWRASDGETILLEPELGDMIASLAVR